MSTSICRQDTIADKIKELDEKFDEMNINNPLLLQDKIEFGL